MSNNRTYDVLIKYEYYLISLMMPTGLCTHASWTLLLMICSAFASQVLPGKPYTTHSTSNAHDCKGKQETVSCILVS